MVGQLPESRSTVQIIYSEECKQSLLLGLCNNQRDIKRFREI